MKKTILIINDDEETVKLWESYLEPYYNVISISEDDSVVDENFHIDFVVRNAEDMNALL